MKNKTHFLVSISLTLLSIICFNSCKKKTTPVQPPVSQISTNIPSLVTLTVTNLTDTSVVCGGSITATGDGNITSSGLCWDTISNPTLANNKISSLQTSMSFSNTISPLIPGTKYYVRAYATNVHGTAYGNEVSFTTTKSPRWVSWSKGIGEMEITAIQVVNNDLYASTKGGGVFKSTGGQNNWTALNSGLADLSITDMIYANNHLFVATPSGVFVSANNGSSWTLAITGLTGSSTNLTVGSFASDGNKIYARTITSGWEEIFMTSNNGQQWSWITSGQNTIKPTALAAYNNSVYFYETYFSSIWSSNNDGQTWTTSASIAQSPHLMNRMVVLNSKLYGCTSHGLLLVNQGSSSYILGGLNTNVIYNTVEDHQGKLYIGSNPGVICTPDNGSSTFKIVNGLKTSANTSAGHVRVLKTYNGSLYAGTIIGGLFKLEE